MDSFNRKGCVITDVGEMWPYTTLTIIQYAPSLLRVLLPSLPVQPPWILLGAAVRVVTPPVVVCRSRTMAVAQSVYTSR